MVAKKEKNSGIEAAITKEALLAGRKIRLLFVDLSNTCRSPAAEQTMNTLLKKEGLSSYFEVSSCSTGMLTSSPPPSGDGNRREGRELRVKEG
eukprot:675204-Hanusia_phi.AAC.19